MTPRFHATNLYRIPALYGRHRLVLTNTTPTTAYRGAGRPNVTYLVERLVEKAARETGIDRIELRRRNLIPRRASPTRRRCRLRLRQRRSARPARPAVEKSEWNTFEARRAEAGRRGKLRGIGCAIFIEPSGGGGSPKEQAAIRFDASGNAGSMRWRGLGPGARDGVPGDRRGSPRHGREKISLRASDPHGPPLVGEGTISSRSMMSHGGAMVHAAREVIRKGLALAATELKVGAQDVVFEKGRYRVRGRGASIGIAELVRRMPASPHPLDALGEIQLARALSRAARTWRRSRSTRRPA